jgi:hypothetical protein
MSLASSLVTFISIRILSFVIARRIKYWSNSYLSACVTSRYNDDEISIVQLRALACQSRFTSCGLLQRLLTDRLRMQGRINHCAICAMAWGPPVQGAPRDAKKIWIAGGPRVGGQGFIYPLSEVASKKKKGRHPPVHKSRKIPWSGPPRSFGMGPPNVLIRACSNGL